MIPELSPAVIRQFGETIHIQCSCLATYLTHRAFLSATTRTYGVCLLCKRLLPWERVS